VDQCRASATSFLGKEPQLLHFWRLVWLQGYLDVAAKREVSSSLPSIEHVAWGINTLCVVTKEGFVCDSVSGLVYVACL
jgi:hypothetical protein